MIEIKPMDRGQVESIASDAVSDAIDFIESEVAEDRIKAQRYFDGEVDTGHEEGRSRVVATKVRDTIRQIKPSLMRVFLSNDEFVQFVPSKPQDVQSASTATKYVHSQFTEKHGFRVLSDVFHDSLLKKAGIAKVYWDEYTKAHTHTYTNLTDEEFRFLEDQDNVEVVEHSITYQVQVDPQGFEIQIPFHDAKIVRTETDGELRVDSVPPEEF